MADFKHDVEVLVATDVQLESPFQLVNVSNVHITGTAETPLIECVQEGAGFLLVAAHNFSFANLTIVHPQSAHSCGSPVG